MITNSLLEREIVQVQGNIVSDMDGDKVMLSIQNGKYYNLGKIGGEIWELISEPISINQLVNQLVSKYDVEEIECKEQVISFIGQLTKENLIKFK